MTEKPKSITDQKTLKLMAIVDPYLYHNIQVINPATCSISSKGIIY
jgi:hypothetical protein